MPKKTSKPRKNRSREPEIKRQIQKLINKPDVKIFWTVERKSAKEIIDNTSVDFFLSIKPPEMFTVPSLKYYLRKLPEYVRIFEFSKVEFEKPKLPEYSDENFLSDKTEYKLKPTNELEFLNYDEEE